MRTALGIALLVTQVVWMIREQAGPSRYFCWAPNDYMTAYRIEVTVGGTPQPPNEVRSRYRIEAVGVTAVPPQHVIDIIEQREHTYGARDSADVVLRYRLNGHAEQTWKYAGSR